MRRVSIVGTSGSGKSTVGASLASRLGVAFLELDAVRHQPGWVPLPDDEFRHRVDKVAHTEGWVIDGNYSVVRDLVWGQADTVVWLDRPRWLVMARVVRRSLLRVVTGQELWNGNRERWRNLLSLRSERSVVAWAWTSHGRNGKRYEAAMADPAWSRLRFIRICSRRDLRRLLAGP